MTKRCLAHALSCRLVAAVVLVDDLFLRAAEDLLRLLPREELDVTLFPDEAAGPIRVNRGTAAMLNREGAVENISQRRIGSPYEYPCSVVEDLFGDLAV